MDVTRLRSALADLLGPERNRKFILQLNHRNRLRAWQEEAVTKFLAAYPEFAPLGRAELLASFAICEVHGNELQSYSVPVFRGNVDYAPDYNRTRVPSFPNAKRDFWSTEGAPFEGDSIELWFCPTCCEAERQWHAGRESSK